MILTDFVRSGVLATDGYSPAVKNYVNEVVEGDKVEMQLEALNHSIVMENRRISKVTPAVIQAREALLNG